MVVLWESRDIEFRMLSVCKIREEKRMVVKAERRDIYSQVPAI